MTELTILKKPEINWIDPDKVYRKCPVCKIGYLDRRISRDPFVKYVLFWRNIRRYKCNYCDARVYLKKATRKNKKVH